MNNLKQLEIELMKAKAAYSPLNINGKKQWDYLGKLYREFAKELKKQGKIKDIEKFIKEKLAEIKKEKIEITINMLNERIRKTKKDLYEQYTQEKWRNLRELYKQLAKEKKILDKNLDIEGFIWAKLAQISIASTQRGFARQWKRKTSGSKIDRKKVMLNRAKRNIALPIERQRQELSKPAEKKQEIKKQPKKSWVPEIKSKKFKNERNSFDVSFLQIQAQLRKNVNIRNQKRMRR